MNKKKSQEYLHKINNAFAALTEHPYEIEIDSLLGYVRIFYSSLKELPAQPSNPVVVDIPETAPKAIEIKTSVPASNFESPEIDLKNEKETIVINNVIDDVPIHPDVEAIDHPVIVDENTAATPLTAEIKAEQKHEESPSVPLKPVVEIIDDVKEELISITAEITEPESETKAEPVHSTVSAETNVDHVIEPDINKVAAPPEKVRHADEDHTLPANTPPYTIPAPKHDSPIEIVESTPLRKTLETDRMESVTELYRPKPAVQYDNENDAIENLFRDKSPTGLVDFLSLSPLDNLTKAWGLNDKMLIIKDLFNNDLQAFESTVEAINKATSMKEAKNYLIENVVRHYEWHDLRNIKRASNFIMQTKRLFVDK